MAQPPGRRPQFSPPPTGVPPIRPSNLAFAPFGALDSIRGMPRSSPTVTIGSQAYREVDNGGANVLVAADEPLGAAQREGIVRALFMTEHPFGTVAYGAATMSGAPQRGRDAALQVGGIVDGMSFGAAPRARTVRSRSPAPRIQGLAFDRGPIWFGGDTRDKPATYVSGAATAGMIGTGSKPNRKIKPPGWSGNGRLHNEARGHLAAARYGGPGDDPRNLATITQNRTNSSHMKRFENSIARMALGGEVVEYLTMPLYTRGNAAPSSILMTAHGSRSGPSATFMPNPAGRRR
jgi:hypothetical protein